LQDDFTVIHVGEITVIITYAVIVTT